MRIAFLPRRLLLLVTLLSLLAAAAAPAPASAGPSSWRVLAEEEATPSSVEGLVLDDSGAVIPGAAVTLEVAGLAPATTFSDVGGRFTFDRVQPGPVMLSVSMAGFAPATLRLPASRSALRIVLQPGGVSEHVTIFADGSSQAISAATKTPSPLRDVPQAVAVIPRQLMAEQAVRAMADVVRYVPGIGVSQGEGNRDALVFRGSASAGDFFADGVRDDVQYFRDVYNVERVEAIKGPNALMFGRGGAGGVINRVTRQAGFTPTREVALQGGAFSLRRISADLGQVLGRRLATRVTGVYETSGSYRRGVNLRRYGVNPTFAVAVGAKTMVTGGYERFHDERTADRGIPSFNGRPLETPPSTFFGDARDSIARVTVNAATAALEHRVNTSVAIRTVARVADYDKFYQNVFPGAVNAARTSVALSGYSHGTARRNTSNQTDVTWWVTTGPLRHTLLAGSELTRQVTNNRRLTAYFLDPHGTATSVAAPLSAPVVSLAIDFRPSATDADNRSVAGTAAVYLQDQVQLTRRLQAIAGLRYEDFGVSLHDNRRHADVRSRDRVVAPRVGVVYKPTVSTSLYGSYSRAYQPRAGEQLSSLTVTNHALEPERFMNYEVGAKWDLRPRLSLSSAVYRLDRANVAVPVPTNPSALALVDGQRATGVELGLQGHVTAAWSTMVAYAYQDGRIRRSLSATAAAGARLGQLPRHAFSMWNRYDLSRRVGVGLGIVRQASMFASTDNTVVLPGYTRVDAAAFVPLGTRLRCQANVENLFDSSYYPSANGNNNITPGSPRALRVALVTSF